MKKFACVMVFAALLSACGGGGGSPGTCVGSAAVCFPISKAAEPAAAPPFVEPAIAPMASVARQCAAPRPAGMIDPDTQLPYGDMPGSLDSEKAWIRSFVNGTYLWYPDVVPLDPARFVIGATVAHVNPANNSQSNFTITNNFDVLDAYFNSQRSLLTTTSGKPKDQFHFVIKTDEWQALSSSGSSVDFGFHVALLAGVPPRNALVAYTDPGTPAAANNLLRGAQFIAVNGVDVIHGSDIATLDEGLFSPIAGKQYTFDVLDPGSATPRRISMTAGTVTSVPVQNVHTLPAPYGSVGYMLFNDHIATAEVQLVSAINQLNGTNGGAGISDLVLDLRYNGGGLLDIANELAYMIAGPAQTAGKTFESLSFNDKNPFNFSAADTVFPFLNQSQGFSVPRGQALPQLGLGRVFVITGSGTCSASEAIINGLRGAGITVIQIGSTSCGKPYGFYPQDNCGVTYFAIQFKGVNHLGFGDYADGFSPGGTGTPANHLPGCAVADDFTRQLGDIAEGRLATALQYRADGSCSGVIATAGKKALRAVDAGEPLLLHTPMRFNRFIKLRAGN